jgi:arylsulfatase A
MSGASGVRIRRLELAVVLSIFMTASCLPGAIIQDLSDSTTAALFLDLKHVSFEDVPNQSTNVLEVDGIVIRDSWGITVGPCPAPTCLPDPNNVNGPDVANQVIILNQRGSDYPGGPLKPGGRMAFATAPQVVALDLQGTGDYTFTFVVTDRLGNQAVAGRQYVPFGQVLLGIYAEAGVAKIEVAEGHGSGEGTGRACIASIAYQNDVLEAPSHLASSRVWTGPVQLTWTDNSANETGFIIERHGTNDAAFHEVGRVAAGTTTFTDLQAAGTSSPLVYRVAAAHPLGLLAYTGELVVRKRPNILLILADDLGPECLNVYGGTSYRTPNINELARTGLRFANCYATPLCSPSRVQLMTGRYGFRTGWTNLINRGTPDFLNPAEFNFAHLLKQAGYRTAVAGKWQLAEFPKHPNHVNECGFDEYRCWAWEIDGMQTERYWKPAIWENGQLWQGATNEYGENLFCDFLIDFMKRERTNSFFAYYPMTLVHLPYESTPDNRTSGARGLENFPAMVAYMDKTVGRIVRALDTNGLREKTLILFAGDNGSAHEIVSEANGVPIRGGKGTLTHIGAHVPLIASWKGTLSGGRVAPQLVDFSDVLPTLAEISGAEVPSDLRLDGHSFAPLLRGQQMIGREWVFVQLGGHRFARDVRWLLHDDGRVYNIFHDPFETRNMSTLLGPTAKAEVKKLRTVLRQLVP